MSKLREHLDNGNNLPEWMKDFHDQKDLFKAIYDQWGADNEVMKRVNWIDAHVLSIDIFLWWMGLHGYKLQKDKTKGIEFYDPQETIKMFNDKRSDAFTNALNEILTKDK